jgi:tetratricopeptide (TPR) repeat protein
MKQITMRRFLGVLLAATLTVSVLPMILLAQTADYNSALAQAKADLSAGHNAEALAGSQKAIGIDPSRWEAYLVAGSALENQKQFDPAIDNYTKALERAPEAKKAGVRDLLEQCKKLTAASPGVSAPALTAQSPTFKETLDWLISKNGEEGIMWFVHFDSNVDEFSFHVDFSIPPDPTCWSGLTNDTRSPWKYPELVHPVLIDFSALAPNSIGVKRLDAHHLGVVGTYEGTITSPHDVYYQVTGLRGYVNGDTESPPRHEFDFQTNYRAPIYADQDLANRVAKALNHAIDVCGGKGKPEAF